MLLLAVTWAVWRRERPSLLLVSLPSGLGIAVVAALVAARTATLADAAATAMATVTTLVGAGALVTEGKQFADGSMIIGSPAKAVRQLTAEQMEALRQGARHYSDNARRFLAGLKKIG